MSNPNDWLLTDFLSLPRRDWRLETEYDSIVFFPMNELHSSGYLKMGIVGVREGDLIELISTFSDDIEWLGKLTSLRTECLSKSMAMQMWSPHRGDKFVVGSAASNVMITVVRRY